MLRNAFIVDLMINYLEREGSLGDCSDFLLLPFVVYFPIGTSSSRYLEWA